MLKAWFDPLKVTARTAFLLGTALSSSQAFAQAALATEEAAQSGGIEEIVVTAQKREQSLQDVPISITALTANAIAVNRIQDVRDLNALAPSLSIRLSNGGAQIPTITLRGLLTGGTAAGTDKGVALYLDGVYLQSVQGSVFDFADIERIEVLKGPQGTLFGRNSTGGAISITTRNPTGEFGVKQDLTYGNYDQFRSKTRIDLPQLGPFSASVTYLHSQRRGDIRNSGAGTTFDFGPATNGVAGKRTAATYLGSDNIEAVMATVKADLIDNLSLIYKFDYSENHFTPNAAGVGFLPAGTPISAIYNASPNPKTPISTTRPDAVNNDFTSPGFQRNQGHNLTATYRASDVFTFKNILSFRKSLLDSTYTLSGAGGTVTIPVSGLAPVPIPSGTLNGAPRLKTTALGVPFQLLSNYQHNVERQWSDEFQVNITTDWFTATAGYIHFYNKVATNGLPGTFNSYTLLAFNGQDTSSPNTPFVVPGNPGFVPTVVTSKSDAWYVQPEIHLTNRLDIVGGARITMDTKNGFETLPNQAIASSNNPGAIRPIQSVVRYRDSEASFMVGLNWKPTDDILLYAKYADGYISGGQLATIAFKPERAYSYEGGVKAELFDRRVRSNLAVYHVDYKALQFTTSGLLTGVASSALFGQAVVQSGNARANGFEWENTIAPIRGVTLGANFGYTDFKFDQATIFPGFLISSGAPGYLEFARPKWTINLSSQYDSPELFGGVHFMARIDGNFRSKQLLSSDVAIGSGLKQPETPGLRDAATAPASWLVNGRMGLSGFEIGGAKAEVAVWGKNIFDNNKIVQFSGLDLGAVGYIAPVIYERARTFGVDLTVQF
jgi:iron complex outermembrane receptor protein